MATIPNDADGTVEEDTITQVIVVLDLAAEGPDATGLIERLFASHSEVLTWRVVNPASEEEQAFFQRIGERLRSTFEEQGPMEPMF